ncbi:MAG: histidine phosphatase family protein [Candidatus Gastranaerophilales bacterium]|nr:histidine phosphatase family protein [Candidatus Gastranaerophilales bacterium]
MFDLKCKIIFIGHGSTLYSEQNRLYDVDEYPPLNEQGKKEIEKISNWLKSCSPNVDAIFASSALRSVQSARTIAKIFRKDFEILDNLYDRRAGIWGGMTFRQVQEKYPVMLEEYHKNPCNFWPEDGESTKELNNRVITTIDNIIQDNFQKKIVLITNVGIIQSAISLAMDINPKNQARVYIPPGSATQINYYTEWSSLVYSGYVPV